MSDDIWQKGIEAPLSVKQEGDVDWSETADVVVIGLGGAGVSASLQALEEGLSVIALERFEGGGATKASGGVVYLGGGTETQKKAGVDDDPANMKAYLKEETGDIVSDETLGRFCDQSSDNEAWLTRHGVRFEGTLWPDKTSYPNAEYYLYHSDNSLVPAYKSKARPAARGHRGWVPLKQGRKAINLGGSVFDPLYASATKLGLKTHRMADVSQIVLDESGKVLGVKVRMFEKDGDNTKKFEMYRAKSVKWMTMYPPILPGSSFFFKRGIAYSKKAAELETQKKDYFIRATKGVVISAGGFAFNKKMVKHFAPNFSRGYPLGTEGDDGAGIKLGKSVGGQVGNMQRMTAWRFINPPYSFARGLVVNTKAERFINEMVYGATMGVEIGENQEGKAWLILDKKLAKAALSEVSGNKALPFQRDLARLNIWLASKTAKTLEDLAKKIHIDPAALADSVAKYNAHANSETEDPFGKEAKDCSLLDGSKYYAINIGIGAQLFPCPTLSLGGLKVDEETGAVLSENGGVVDGLYAAGRSAIGICSWNYVSGLSIADCIFSGRRAGKSLAAK